MATMIVKARAIANVVCELQSEMKGMSLISEDITAMSTVSTDARTKINTLKRLEKANCSISVMDLQ